MGLILQREKKDLNGHLKWTFKLHKKVSVFPIFMWGTLSIGGCKVNVYEGLVKWQECMLKQFLRIPSLQKGGI